MLFQFCNGYHLSLSCNQSCGPQSHPHLTILSFYKEVQKSFALGCHPDPVSGSISKINISVIEMKAPTFKKECETFILKRKNHLYFMDKMKKWKSCIK